MRDWEFEKAGRVVKVAPMAKLIANYPGVALRAALDGVGFWPTFEGYVRDDVKSGALVSVLEDWCAPFPGPFLYYPSRRQPPPALRAFIAFVAEWRKQERRRRQILLHRRQGRVKISGLTACSAARDPAACGRRGRCGC